MGSNGKWRRKWRITSPLPSLPPLLLLPPDPPTDRWDPAMMNIHEMAMRWLPSGVSFLFHLGRILIAWT